ncbi:MAG: YgaP family membrane protein [Candidatus Kapaibacteriota bacterium]|jgi:glucose uptake protein GlcU
MKLNMGSFDRTLRIILAIVLGLLILFRQLTGVGAIIFGIIALIFLITGIIGFCPLYAPFKINTAKGEQKESK